MNDNNAQNTAVTRKNRRVDTGKQVCSCDNCVRQRYMANLIDSVLWDRLTGKPITKEIVCIKT